MNSIPTPISAIHTRPTNTVQRSAFVIFVSFVCLAARRTHRTLAVRFLFLVQILKGTLVQGLAAHAAIGFVDGIVPVAVVAAAGGVA